MKPGDRLTLVVEKPAAGGRMIARHNGAIVLVSAAIPGETVEAVVEKVQRGTGWARTTRVVEPSADRVEAAGEWACGGSVFAHIAYARQLVIKQEIVRDAFTRIARLQPPDSLPIHRSPIDGYRMRARLHVLGGRAGFFKEGSHDLCDPAPTRQLLPATIDVLHALERALASASRADIAEIEVSENRPADERTIHLDLAPDTDPSRLGLLPEIAGVTGISCGPVGSRHALVLAGSPLVTDRLTIASAAGPLTVTLARHTRSFFQGNRFLLPELVAAVVDGVPSGRVLDLYAGVGLFAAALAARGDTEVTAVEGDRSAAHDLKGNAHTAGGTMTARHQAVETFLAVEKMRPTCVVVDPPRTGLSKEAMVRLAPLGATRIVYVSCDVATLARDARVLVDARYRLTSLSAFDLFPNTAHVESLAVFDIQTS
jgi:23S rRNA (uracil1939-C5)-methyltransferase